jgi:hypothetical protein
VPIEVLSLLVSLLDTVVQVWQVTGDRLDRTRRSSPLIVVHEDASTRGGLKSVGLYLTVDRALAVNVRFGIEVDGVRVPFHRDPTTYREGSRERVVRPESRTPEDGAFGVEIPWWMSRGRELDFRYRLFFWARYEDESGHTWETINPADESKRLVGPLRIRSVWLRRYQEELRRTKMRAAAKGLA